MMVKKNKLYRTCVFCGKVGVAGEEVFWLDDPYTQDVQDKESKEWLHIDCSNELASDV